MKKRFFLIGVIIAIVAILLVTKNYILKDEITIKIGAKEIKNYKLEDTTNIYYDSLNKAISDINNEQTNNSISNNEEASVVVENSGNEKSIKLLNDIEETDTLEINNNVTINLNGHKINITGTDATTEEVVCGFKIKENVTLNIDGTIENSEIKHRESLGKKFYLFDVDLDGCININGGTYNLYTLDEQNTYLIYGDVNTQSTKGIKVSIVDAKINIESERSAAVVYHNINKNDSEININNNEINIRTNSYSAVCYTGYSKLKMDNNKIDICSNNSGAYGIWSNGNNNIINNEIKVVSNASSGATIYGVRYFGVENEKCEINNNEITCICSSVLDGRVIGIINMGSLMIVRDTTVLCDCPNNNKGDSDEEKRTTSGGINSSTGRVNIFNSNVTTTDYCITASQETNLYVNGGTYQSYGHGPFYFSNGQGENYVENATLISLNKNEYNGLFSTADWYDISSCMYIGGGENEHNSGVSVNIDNSILYDKGSKSGYFVLRGTSGEQNLSLHISNSEFRYEETEKMRIDHSSDHVYFGRGNTFTNVSELPENISLSGNATVENNIHFTDEEYKKEIVETDMEIESLPKKLKYIKDVDNLDLSEGSIKITNNIGVEEIIDMTNPEIQVLGFDNTGLGKQLLTVKYKDLEEQFEVELEEEKIESTVYEFDEEGTICYIKPNTNVSEFRENIISNVSYKVENQDGEIQDEEIIGSEDIIVTKSGRQIIIVVIGDTTGDGKADIKDMIKINNYRLFNTEENFGDIFKKAADVNKDNKINIRDMIRINNYRLFGTEF